MEKSYFWNSVDGDRKYNAESISDMLLPFFKPGVFAGDLQVTAPGGMKVQIAGSEDRGFAWFRTKNYHNTANLVKDISAASGVFSRIDNVVVRKDTPNRMIYITIQEGTFATVPEAPAILRNAEFYDLKLAEITIPSGAIEITQANIKDCRMDANVCGWVAATIEEMDFTQMSAQFDTYMEEYQEAAETEFTTWFNAMKGQLTTDAAGNLQTQIDSLEDNIDSVQSSLISALEARRLLTYTSVEQLGLTPATCTLASIWEAMPPYSELVVDTANLSSITFPVEPGILSIIKGLSSIRVARFEFVAINYTPWFMQINSSGLPTGTWIQYAAKEEVVLKAEQLVTLSSTGWVSMSGGYYKTVTLTGAVETSNPDWCLKPAGQIPTATEKTNDALILNAEFGTNIMTFFASAIPSASLQYRVKGV